MTSNMTGSAGSFDYFALDGTIDATCERFFTDLPANINHSLVRFNFARAGRINSMGIALLLSCFKEIREKKQAHITLEGLAPMHDMLFKMTGIFLLASPIAAGSDGKGARS